MEGNYIFIQSPKKRSALLPLSLRSGSINKCSKFDVFPTI